MALLENGFKGMVPNGLVGVGIAIATLLLLPAIAVGLRPVAKTLIRGGLYVTDAARDVVTGAAGQVSDLIAEARAEGHGAGTEG